MAYNPLIARNRQRRIYEPPPNPYDAGMGMPTPGMQPRSPEPLPGSTTMAPVEEEPNDSGQFFEEIMRLRGNMPMTSQYRQHLQSAPRMSDSKPSNWRIAAAALAGGAQGFKGDVAGAVDTAQNIIETPYRRKMQDYAAKAQTLGAGANLEGADVEAQTKALSDARSLGLKYSEYQHMIEKDRATQRTADQNADSNTSRAASYARYVDNPEYIQTQEMTGVRWTNRNNPRDTFFAPGATVASVTAESGRRSSQAAATNAETSRRAQEHDVTYDNQRLQQMGRDLQIRSQLIGRATPQAQESARNTALREMASDPAYRSFMTDPGDGFPTFSTDLDTDSYEDMLSALKIKMEKILQMNQGGDPNMIPEEDIEPDQNLNDWLVDQQNRNRY